jgi:hypothetical protein
MLLGAPSRAGGGPPKRRKTGGGPGPVAHVQSGPAQPPPPVFGRPKNIIRVPLGKFLSCPPEELPGPTPVFGSSYTPAPHSFLTFPEP